MAPAFRRGDENRPQRWILASSRVNGTAVPGSLSEGAAERSEAEGVSFDERKRSKISEFICAGGKSLAWRNHRGTLPQSRPFGRASSLREGAGMGRVPFNRPPGRRKVAGDFHRPYEGSECFTFYRSTGVVSKWVQKSVRVHCSMGVLNIQLEIYFFQWKV